MREEISVNKFLNYLYDLDVEINTKVKFVELSLNRSIHNDTIRRYGDDILYINSKIEDDCFTIYVKMPLNITMEIKLED